MLTSPCACAASEQFTGLLQSGYLGVDCGDQVRIVDRHIGLLYPVHLLKAQAVFLPTFCTGSIFITTPPHSMSYRLQSGAACDQKLATQASRG